MEKHISDNEIAPLANRFVISALLDYFEPDFPDIRRVLIKGFSNAISEMPGDTSTENLARRALQAAIEITTVKDAGPGLHLVPRE
ncbi:hypothetical protein [Burkholderia gladioli]|uniref:hypothetical protein n=1 Tax=Burkholderia gladioli TaxID=28095 RepID=UPI0011B211B1|nr:hypothetical protein [Burkholderia gladioli]